MLLPAHQKLIMIAPPVAVFLTVAGLWLFVANAVGYFDWLIPVQDRPIPSINEPVLAPGMKLLVHSPSGDVTIAAGNGRKRTFDWDNGSRSLELEPRYERWDGKFGLYGEGHWLPHHGINYGQSEEAQLNFSSTAEAEDYQSKTPAFVPYVYRNDGLTTWISKQQNHFSVEIFQIYVNGVKPLKLKGAQDEKILLPQGIQTAAVTKAPADSSDFNERNASYRFSKVSGAIFYDSFFNMGEDFFKSHQYDDALDCYESAVFAKPSVYLFLQRARCFLELGKFDLALKECKLAGKLDPKDKTVAPLILQIKTEAAGTHE